MKCADLPLQPDADRPRARHALVLDRCPDCGTPTHASESDDEGCCAGCRPAFDAGHADGYSDAVNGHPRDPAQRFQSWHRKRPVEQFAEYEAGYTASYRQVAKEIA